MHKVMRSLAGVTAECERTDAIAKILQLSITPVDADEFHWGYSDHFLPKKACSKPLHIGLWRDVFLMPDAEAESEYRLGFEDELMIGPGQVIIAYRLELSHRFADDAVCDFPVTVFWEAVSKSWKASARIRYGEKIRARYERPEFWTDILQPYGLDEFGELAAGITTKRALLFIERMMHIIKMHGPNRRRFNKR